MFSSLAVFSIVSLLIGVECSATSGNLKCSHSAKLDLQLIVDSSLSVGETDFHLMMQKIADDVVGQFDIGKDKTRVSLFKYSSPKVMVEEFDLDTYTDAASLRKAMKAVKYEGGWTKTAEAMEKALTHYSAKMRKGKETAKACIVFTDGKATDAAQVPAALKAWEKLGVSVFALGIGEKIKDAGLEDITGSTDRLITVPDINAIGKVANSLLVKVCKAIRAGSCFIFKKEDEKAYVRLHPLQDEPLNDFTIDFTYEFSDATSEPYFLSYFYSKTYSGPNELVIGQKYGLIQNSHFYKPTSTPMPLEIGTIERVTITRMNSEISVYVNGEFVQKFAKIAKIANPIRPGGSWILGQEQDQKEGGFQKHQRFTGKICDFQIWDYGMNQESLKKLFMHDGSIKAGNVFDSPPSYALETKDGATQMPQTCFTFKKEDEKAYVRLHPLQDEPLNDFTIDFSYKFSDVTSEPYFLSYFYSKTYSGPNELVIGQKYGMIQNSLFYKSTSTPMPLEIGTTERVTITRMNSEISVYVNGEFVQKFAKIAKIANPIRPGGSWILGQEQDQKEGGFQKNQRFTGKVCDFQMWDYGMNQESLKKLFLHDGSVAPGNIFDSPPTYVFEKKNGAL